jgi:predicted nucleic acid-binding Zn ribbon protein
MTAEQKNKINDLRLQGLSYSEISDSVSLSLNTIKSYCQRHNIKPTTISTASVKVNRCQNCGKAIILDPKRKPKKFCCEKCRNIWWNNNRRNISGAVVKTLCANCGNEFEKYKSSNQIYCCHACYIKARFGETQHD